jgi:hypothetical protein
MILCAFIIVEVLKNSFHRNQGASIFHFTLHKYFVHSFALYFNDIRGDKGQFN